MNTMIGDALILNTLTGLIGSFERGNLLGDLTELRNYGDMIRIAIITDLTTPSASSVAACNGKSRYPNRKPTPR
jgi:hypothetical protein